MQSFDAFMCHMGNSNTLRKIWYKDYDEYGNDGYGHDTWIGKLEYTKKKYECSVH